MDIKNKYKSLDFEKKLVMKSIITSTFTLFACLYKVFMGIVVDPVYFMLASFSLFLLLSKVECIIGILTDKKDFNKRNKLISLFLFLGGLLFLIYMILDTIFDIYKAKSGFYTSIISAAISFSELGIAIYGFNKAKYTSYFYRDIKIISIIFALNAMISTEIALLTTFGEGKSIYYSIMGIVVGIITILISIYVYFEPKIGAINKEINNYKLVHPSINKIIDMSKNDKFYISKSWTCGSYYYEYEIINNEIYGKIKQEKNIFKRSNIIIKILFIILSEILLFVYGFIYLIFFFRNINIIKRLDKKMNKNGFIKIEN